jgi:hypothetical protein
MNVIVLCLAAWVCFGLESALPPVLDAGSGGVHPSVVIPLLVFVALHAETRAAIWTALTLGLVTDLLTPVTMLDGGSAVIPGPHALTLVVLSVVGSLASSITVVAVMGLRTIIDDSVAWTGASGLITGFWSALYTALSALVLSFPLFAAAPLFGFQHPQAQRFSRRE